MTEELSKALAALATKLGTNVEHLWGVLIRQAYIDGVSSLLTVICTITFGLGAIYFFFHLKKKNAEWLAKYGPPPGMDYFFLAIILFFVVAIAGSNLYWVISDFFNPEFYALRQLPGWRN
jgi:hypothetical protein